MATRKRLSPFSEEIMEGSAANKRHHEIGLRRLLFHAEVIDMYNMRMVECSYSTCLTEEAFAELGLSEMLL